MYFRAILKWKMLFRLLLWNIREILKTGLRTFFLRMRTEAHSNIIYFYNEWGLKLILILFIFYNEWGLKLCRSTVKVTQWLFVRINSKFKSLFTGDPSCSELLNRSLSHDEFNFIWDHFVNWINWFIEKIWWFIHESGIAASLINTPRSASHNVLTQRKTR